MKKKDYQQIFEQKYSELNDRQKQAVDEIYGPVMVVAGPGSGKTQLLSLRVANILQKTDTDPSSILCLTFTDLATANMKKRLRSIVGPEAEKVNFFTFHGFAKSVIDDYGEYFFGGFEAQPLDALQQTRFLHQILHDLEPSNPLFSIEQNQKHGHLNSVQSKIKDLKLAGITPFEFEEILGQNKAYFELVAPIFGEFFADKMTVKILAKLPDFVASLKEVGTDGYFARDSQKSGNFADNSTDNSTNNLSVFQSYKSTILEQLDLAVKKIDELGGKKTSPLTQFKDHFCKKNLDGKVCLKDQLNMNKNLALAGVYATYQELLGREKLYDFSDMILEVIQKMRQNRDLKLTVQEKYQFIMVDEFQDTNGGQMALINELVDTSIPNSTESLMPNLMVVGDDDQSVFKFQGANLDNILGFKEKFGGQQNVDNSNGLKVVILDKNYRSNQDILDFAKEIVEQIGDRLTSRLGVEKPLVSGRLAKIK